MGCKLAKASAPASADKVATGEKQPATDATTGNKVLLGKSKTVNMLGAQQVNVASDADTKKPPGMSTALIEKVDGDQSGSTASEDPTPMPTNAEMTRNDKPQDEQLSDVNSAQSHASATAHAANSNEADSKQLPEQMGAPLDPSSTSGANSQTEPPVADSGAEGNGAGAGQSEDVAQAYTVSTSAQQELTSNVQTEEVEGQGQYSQKMDADSQGNPEKKRKQREPCCGC